MTDTHVGTAEWIHPQTGVNQSERVTRAEIAGPWLVLTAEPLRGQKPTLIYLPPTAVVTIEWTPDIP